MKTVVIPNLSRYLPIAALTLLLFLVVGPIVGLIADCFLMDGLSAETVRTLIFPTGRRFTLLWSSIMLALASATTCVILSWFISSFLWQQTRRYTSLLSYVMTFIAFVALLPPFIHSYTWMTVFNEVNHIFISSFSNEVHFSGIIASWWTQTMAWLPLCLSAALFGFRCIDPDLIEAAQLSASPLKVLISIIIPLTAPAVLAGGMLVFLMCLQEYSIPSLFQVNTYALDIFSDYSAHNQPFRTLLISGPIVVLNSAVLISGLPFFRHVATAVPRLGRVQAIPFIVPLWIRGLQKAFLLLLFIQVLMPLVILVKTGGSLVRFGTSVMAAMPEIIFSVQTAFSAAILAIGIAMLVLVAPIKKWHLVALPLAAFSLSMPATLTGIGTIVLFGTYLFHGVYGSDSMPVIVAVARFGPLALLLVLAQVSRLDQKLFEAASFYQVSKWQCWLKIKIPLILPGLIVAFITVFLLTMGELSATLLVLPPGRNTLAVKTYNLLHYGASDAVADLCLFIIVTGWVLGIIATAALVKRR